MTRAGTYLDANGRQVYLYYLLNPDSGTHNIDYTLSAAYDSRCIAQSYEGVKQSDQPDDYDTNSSAGATSLTTSSTIVSANSWLVSFAFGSGDSGTPPVAGEGTTRRYPLTSYAMSGGDSNGGLSIGNQTSVWETTGSGTWNVAQMSISPAPVNSPSVSASLSPSASASPSASGSASSSASQSPSASGSPSASVSLSPSSSESKSSSASASKSASKSLSPSASSSASESASISPSASNSSSLSASPSPAEYDDKYTVIGNAYINKYTSVGSRIVD
jgi:hypothetical protein